MNNKEFIKYEIMNHIQTLFFWLSGLLISRSLQRNQKTDKFMIYISGKYFEGYF